ncbi:hypothetical protein [Pedobacter hartonius]|uniref:TspO and MBR related proteins n=1 Tax=Pedobacter hartonius TaxID=425514 RepID=A0A1H4E049_9SPHI|nr:hypothetical protein [Pedobacter hartonius]SEA78296.1 hypothetical protein SAMN05443550_105179 [Pedobacter hartonius]
MKRLLQILNIVTLFFAIAINYLFNGQQDKPSIGEISAKYENLLTPAGYAFGIWGLIYISLIVFAVYQSADLFRKDLKRDFIFQIGWWFIIANLANAAWVWAFTNDQPGLSLLIMVVIFFSLLKIVLHTNMERWDAPNPVIFYIWWPFSLYFGWINVALIINISAYLTAIGWNGNPVNAETWAILVLLLASLIFITMTWRRNMREYANVGVWGIVAIAVKNWNNHPAVAWVAVAVAVVIFINASAHGYLNRATAPFAKKVKQI